MRPIIRTAPLILVLISSLLAARPDASRAGGPPPVQTFDIVVSLEWEPGRQDVPDASLPSALAASGCPPDARATYLEDLAAGLADASQFIYTYSLGRFALGTVTIDTDGSQWSQADIRVLADAAYRPTADVGGIVAAPTSNSSAATGVSVTFYPGAVTLGRAWDGRGARCGAWSQPEAWRTIGHEWGHYALYLWDSYYEQFTLREEYCTTTGFARIDRRRGERAPATLTSGQSSVMAYHYTTDRLWESGAPAGCAQTPQMRVNGVSDWETIQRFYPGVGAPTDAPTGAGPAPTIVVASAAPTEYTTARIQATGFPATDTPARAYLVRSAGGGGLPLRIIGQGELLPGEQAALIGARPSLGDRAHIAYEDWSGGGRAAYPASPAGAPALPTAPGGEATSLGLTTAIWRPAMRITPVVNQISPTTSELVGLRLRIEDCARATKQIQLVFCPAGGACHNQQTLAVGSGGVFSASITLPGEVATRQSAARGYIYLRGIDTGEELISTYQIGGGAGSGHIGAHPPLLDAAVHLETPAGQDPPAGQDMRVITSGALVCQAPPLPPGVRGVVGSPVDIQPVLASQQGGRPWGSLASDPPLAVRLSYSQDLIDRLGIDERSLVLLRVGAQGAWEVVPAAGRSADLDWVGGAALGLQGGGAIYALGYADLRVALPLVAGE